MEKYQNTKPECSEQKNLEDGSEIYENIFKEYVARKAIERKLLKTEERRKRANELAYTNTLSGCISSNYYEEIVEIVDESDSGKLAIVLFDIDQLGLYNKLYGQTAGDYQIRTTAHHLMKSLGISTEDIKQIADDAEFDDFRKKNILARIGGDEFALLHYLTEEEQQDSEFLKHYEESIRNTVYADKPSDIYFQSGLNYLIIKSTLILMVSPVWMRLKI